MPCCGAGVELVSTLRSLPVVQLAQVDLDVCPGVAGDDGVRIRGGGRRASTSVSAMHGMATAASSSTVRVISKEASGGAISIWHVFGDRGPTA
jgi:hypothetical protein